MRGIDSDIMLDERAYTLIPVTDDRVRPAPEHSVVNEYQLRSSLNRTVDRRGREINSRYDACDVSLVCELHAVQRAGIVGYVRDIQQLVDECGDLGESRHFFAADVSTWTV